MFLHLIKAELLEKKWKFDVHKCFKLNLILLCLITSSVMPLNRCDFHLKPSWHILYLACLNLCFLYMYLPMTFTVYHWSSVDFIYCVNIDIFMFDYIQMTFSNLNDLCMYIIFTGHRPISGWKVKHSLCREWLLWKVYPVKIQ